MTKSRGRILIVDDEPAILALLRAVLTRAHYTVRTCASGTEALRILAHDEPYDCVITDAMMPAMSGYDLVKTIRQHPQFSSLPILMLTRKRHRLDVKKAVEAGVNDYVLKPIDEHLLLDKVELCVRKSSGKRHVFQLNVLGPLQSAQLGFDCKVTGISENDLAVRVPIAVSSEDPYRFRFKILEEIGLPDLVLKFVGCERLSDPTPLSSLPYEVRFAFLGLHEGDLQKIRSWVQRELVKRKK